MDVYRGSSCSKQRRDRFPPDKFMFRICTNKFLTRMSTPTCHNVPGFSGLYVLLQGNLCMCPRMKDSPCQLLSLPPGWMKGNRKLKPVCFPKYNLCLINTEFKERQRALHQPQRKTLSRMGGLTALGSNGCTFTAYAPVSF